MAERTDSWSGGRPATLAVAVGAVVVAVVVWSYGRGLIFYFDEWDFIQSRRTGFVEPLLRPHNGHLSVLPVAIYRLLFRIAGLEHYGAYRLVLIVFHTGCGVLLYAYGRRRTTPALAAVAALTLLALAAGWQDILWPFQIGFLGSLLLALVALLLLDRDRVELAALAVFGALASSGVGVPVLAGFLVEASVGRTWRRLAWFSAPGAAYASWYLTLGRSAANEPDLTRLPGHLRDSAAFATRALSGLPAPGAAATLGALTIAVAAVAAAVVVPSGRPRLAFAATAALTFWSLTGLTRGALAEPSASRYLYPSGLFLLLLLLESSRALNRRRLAIATAAAAVVSCAGLFVNAAAFREGARFLRENSSFVAGNLGATELARETVGPDFQPDPQRAPQVRAGAYLESVRHLGSPALDQDDLADAPSAVRSAADATLLAASKTALSTPVAPAMSCRVVPEAVPTEVPVVVVVRNVGAVAAAVRTSLFGDSAAAVPLGTLEPGASALIRLPTPPKERSWRLGPGPFEVCAEAG